MLATGMAMWAWGIQKLVSHSRRLPSRPEPRSRLRGWTLDIRNMTVVMLCVGQAPEPSEEVQHVTELPQALARLQAQGRLRGVPEAVLAAARSGRERDVGSEEPTDSLSSEAAATRVEGSRALDVAAS